jgi:hypothetical protein
MPREQRESTSRTLKTLGVALWLCGCTNYATWHSFARSPGYLVPEQVEIIVARTDSVRANDDGGFVDTTVLTVEDDLRERGIEGHIVDATEHPPAPPYVELSFSGYTKGSGVARYFTNGIAGQARVVVDVRALLPDGRVALQGQVLGAEMAYNRDARGGAEAAGHAIAKALTDAKYNPAPPKKNSGAPS